MKMSKITKIVLLPLFMLSCSIPNNNIQYGTVNVNFKFPQKGFSLKTIPQDTEYITMKITSKNSDTITKRINRSDSGKKISIENLLVGERNIEVEAFDIDNKGLAQTQGSVNIEAGRTSQITLELKESLDDFIVNLINFPDNGVNVISELTVGSRVIQKQSVGKQINFGKFPPSKAKLKVVVLAKDSTPLSYLATEEVDVFNNVPVVLNNIDLEGAINVGYEKVAEIFNGSLVNFKNNSKPVVNSFKVSVNDQEQTLISTSDIPLCVNKDDKIKISVDSSDKDGDKLNYFWEKSVLIAKYNYSRTLETERGNILNQVVGYQELFDDDDLEDYSMSFVVTDKKSLVDPKTIYFRISPTPCNK